MDLLTTSLAHICWVGQGLQPAFGNSRPKCKGYQASQSHKLAWREGAVASHLELAAPSTHPAATVRKQSCGALSSPKSFKRAVFLPGSGWARGHPNTSPVGYAKRNSWENSAQPHCHLIARPTVITWWGA